jgi:hypothetical protein
MKASEMICLLAKQIQLNGDRDVTLAVFEDFYDYKPLSVTWDEDKKTIEIYGE